MSNAVWIKAVRISDIPLEKGILFEHADKKIAIFKSDQNFYATDNTCPHRGGPLSEGYLEGTELTCPWHAWTFDVKTGACTNIPGDRIKTYPVKIEKGDVYVQV